VLRASARNQFIQLKDRFLLQALGLIPFFKIATLNLMSIAKEIEKLFMLQFIKVGAQFKINGDEAGQALKGDSFLISHLLVCIISHSFLTLGLNKNISFAWSSSNWGGKNGFRIEIEDDGFGIDPENAEPTDIIEGDPFILPWEKIEYLARLLQGNVTQKSTPGKGRLVTLFLPLTFIPEKQHDILGNYVQKIF